MLSFSIGIYALLAFVLHVLANKQNWIELIFFVYSPVFSHCISSEMQFSLNFKSLVV